ncbi:MAG: CubicO group peptidase (beta-lactamase class C family) [Candidatus Azotimanducaceae bacterium]|jgi:CubicO group peptidase (beta-lactamase class C family)
MLSKITHQSAIRPIATLLLILLTALIPLSHGKTASEVLNDADVKGAIAITDAWIESVRAYRQVPSISVGFVLDQDVLFSKGYGHANLKRKRQATTDTIYSICSISKLFTSIGVMQQRDTGKLTLRDPVRDHLDWFNIKLAHAASGPTRVQGLLTHSSGLPRESDFPYWSDDSHPFPTREEMIEQLANQETLYPADSEFQYSNLAMSLAGELITTHSGEPYEDYVRKNILDPIGLADTRPYFPEDLHGKQMAIGYSGQSRNLKRPLVKPFYARGIAAAAGFTSTVNDLAKFASWHFRTLAGEQNSVLAPNTLREMQRVHWVNPDWKVTWGLGYVVSQNEGGTRVGHSGGCPGYITNFVMVPKNKTAAIALTNAGDGPAAVVTSAMLDTIGKAVKGALKKPVVKEVDNETAEKTSKPQLEKYAGLYSGGIWGGETIVRPWDDKLAVVRVPSNKIKVTKLKHRDGDTFVRLTDEGEERETWQFLTDSDGSVTAVKIHSSISQKVD